jgi:hypothetical protein
VAQKFAVGLGLLDAPTLEHALLGAKGGFDVKLGYLIVERPGVIAKAGRNCTRQ